MKILIIEDDVTLNRLIRTQLEYQGYEVLSAHGGLEGLNRSLEWQPDLVILDVMMPAMDGWEVCRHLRSVSDVPIIMLTAKGTQADVNRGLEIGVDDYVKKPFDMRELNLRIQAILRRGRGDSQNPGPMYDDSWLLVDAERRLVMRRGEPVHLTPTEYRLLLHLVKQAGRVVSKEELLTEAWGPEYAQDTTNVPVYIRYLREKLEEVPGEPRYIVTEWGRGYRFVPQEKALNGTAA